MVGARAAVVTEVAEVKLGRAGAARGRVAGATVTEGSGEPHQAAVVAAGVMVAVATAAVAVATVEVAVVVVAVATVVVAGEAAAAAKAVAEVAAAEVVAARAAVARSRVGAGWAVVAWGGGAVETAWVEVVPATAGDPSKLLASPLSLAPKCIEWCPSN